MDLFVRVSNVVAIEMYKKLGYSVYRTVLEYYTGDPDEDAYGEWSWKSRCYFSNTFNHSRYEKSNAS